MIENKRYWYILFKFSSKTYVGEGNMGFVSDDDNPFNNEILKQCFIERNPDHKNSSLVVLNFIEFKNENDYINFWKKG